MTLDEAIALLKFNNKHIADLKNDDLQQLAEWLEELKSYRASVFSGDMTQAMLKEQYNKAIDDFTEKIIRYVDCGHLCSPTEIRWSDLSVVEIVKKIAEQLKAGDGE